MPDFLAWQRPAVYALATAPRAGVRLAAQLPVTLHDDAGDVAAAASFLLAGPGDVERLTAGQIVGRRPHPGAELRHQTPARTTGAARSAAGTANAPASPETRAAWWAAVALGQEARS